DVLEKVFTLNGILGLGGAEADSLHVQPLADDALDAIKSSSGNEQDVLGIHLNEFLVRVLASPFWRNVDHSALQQLQQRLLYAFARNIAGNGRVVALAGYFVDLIDKYDPPLCLVQIVVCSLQQAGQYAFHI